VIEPFLHSSLLGKALEKGTLDFNLVQIRDFSTDKHKTVDDTPYGGGEGMVIKADVLSAALKSLGTPQGKRLVVLLSPQGQLLRQEQVWQWSQELHELVLICGHYEGVDERFIEKHVDLELSIGDYVLTGGEMPALVVADAVARLIPGVVGNEDSIRKDSLEEGLLKYPQYTRPRDFEGLSVPEVLMSGNHQEILKWRKNQMIERTRIKRPDLWEAYQKGRANQKQE